MIVYSILIERQSKVDCNITDSMCIVHLLFIILIFPTHSPDPRRSSSADRHSNLIGDRTRSSQKYRLPKVSTLNRREAKQTRSSSWKPVKKRELISDGWRKNKYGFTSFEEEEREQMKKAMQQSLLEAEKMQGHRIEENRLMKKALKQSKKDSQTSRLRQIGRLNVASTSNRHQVDHWDSNWKGPWHYFAEEVYILFKLKQFSVMKEKALFFRRVSLLGKEVSRRELEEKMLQESIQRQQKQIRRQQVLSKQALQDSIRISLEMNRWRKQADYDSDLERVLLSSLEPEAIWKVEQNRLEDIEMNFWLQAEKECLQCAKWSDECRFEQMAYPHFRRLMRIKVMGMIDHSLDHLDGEGQLAKRWNRETLEEKYGQFLRLMWLLELRVITDFQWPYAELQIMSARSDSQRLLRINHDQLQMQIHKSSSSFDARRLQQLTRETQIKRDEIRHHYQSQMNQLQAQHLVSRLHKLRSAADQTPDYTTVTRQELLNRLIQLEQIKERNQTKKSLQSQIDKMSPFKPLLKQSQRKPERKTERQTLKPAPYFQTLEKQEFTLEGKRMSQQPLSKISAASRVSKDKDKARLGPLDAPIRQRTSLDETHRVSLPVSRLPMPSTGLTDNDADEIILTGRERRNQSEKQKEAKEISTFDRNSVNNKKKLYRGELLRFNDDNIIHMMLPKTPNELFEEQEEAEPDLFPVDLSDEADSAH